MTDIDHNSPEFASSDQTAFGSSEPLFENQVEVIDPAAVPIEPKKPIWQNPLVLGVVAVLVVLLLVMILAAVLQPARRLTTPQPSPSPLNQVQLGPWQTKITDLQAELKVADPAQQELPFPPVKMELPLVSTKR